MTYRKRVERQYEQKPRFHKKTFQRGKLRARMLTPPKGAQTGQRFYANVMGITRFLSTYLSGKRNVMVSTDRSAMAGYSVGLTTVGNKPFYRITVPDKVCGGY